MLTVIFAADFPLARTGIASTAAGILSHIDINYCHLYCDQDFSICGRRCEPLPALPSGDASRVAIFSHLEYSGLRRLLQRFPRAVVHVGDWPGTYWLSLKNNGKLLKGILGYLRMRYRIAGLPRGVRYLFVTEDDRRGAEQGGFYNALHLPIGVNAPTHALAPEFSRAAICFSGNFRFEPNRDAAMTLIEWAQSHPQYQLHLAGFYAAELKPAITVNVHLHDNVPSVVNFLAGMRPIYVSPVRFGAGAKNKILEAMICGCPIICTQGSLDESILHCASFLPLRDVNELSASIERINSRYDEWLRLTNETAAQIAAHRSWRNVATAFIDLLSHRRG